MIDQTWSMRAPTSMSYTGRDFSCNQACAATPAVPALEDAIDKRLASMTALSITNQLGGTQYSITDPRRDVGFRATATYTSGANSLMGDTERALSSSFMYDVDTRREFDELVERRLVRTGLLNREQRVSTIENSVIARTTVLKPNCTAGSRTAVVFSNRSLRTSWLGAHSHVNAQPDIYSVIINDTGAFIEQRGSEPLGKGVDFSSIHDVIETTTDQYTRVIRGIGVGGLTIVSVERLRAKLAQRLRDLVLIYNYFAFVAQPLGKNRFLTADELMLLLEDRVDFFNRIATAALRTGVATLN
jgi:hypothetical protein